MQVGMGVVSSDLMTTPHVGVFFFFFFNCNKVLEEIKTEEEVKRVCSGFGEANASDYGPTPQDSSNVYGPGAGLAAAAAAGPGGGGGVAGASSSWATKSVAIPVAKAAALGAGDGSGGGGGGGGPPGGNAAQIVAQISAQVCACFLYAGCGKSGCLLWNADFFLE